MSSQGQSQGQQGQTAKQFIDQYDCRTCGGSGYVGPSETPCPQCRAAAKQYQQLRAHERQEQGR